MYGDKGKWGDLGRISLFWHGNLGVVCEVCACIYRHVPKVPATFQATFKVNSLHNVYTMLLCHDSSSSTNKEPGYRAALNTLVKKVRCLIHPNDHQEHLDKVALRSKKGWERDLPIYKDGKSFYHIKRKIINLLTDCVEGKPGIGYSSFNSQLIIGC